MGAHKALMEASNQKILARIEQLKIQRKRAQEFKQKEAIRQQLQKVNASLFFRQIVLQTQRTKIIVLYKTQIGQFLQFAFANNEHIDSF